MPRDGITTDESRWPIVVHRTVGIPSERDVDRFIEKADEHLARETPYVVVFENSLAGSVPGYMRRRARAWLQGSSERLSRHCLGTALVFRSAALRFVMSTMMLVIQHPVPHEVCRTEEEAVRWAERRLAEARAHGERS